MSWCNPEIHTGRKCIWCELDDLDERTARATTQAVSNYVSAELERIRQEVEGVSTDD